MGDIIRFGQKPVTNPSSDASRLEQQQQRRRDHETAQVTLAREEADRITERLRIEGRVDLPTREAFARYCSLLFKELDELGRSNVKDVMAAIYPDQNDPSKQRGRFSNPNQPLNTLGQKWAEVALEAGRRLGKEHRALIDMVDGTQFADNGDTAHLSGLTDAGSETASLLNRMSTACIRENRLADYFETLRFSLYDHEDDKLVATSVLPEAVNLDRLADGLWVDIEPGFMSQPEWPFLPRVPLYTRERRGRFGGAFEGTRLDLPQEDIWNAQSVEKLFDDLALAQGTEEGWIDFRLDVSIGVAPIGANRIPVGCFFVEPKGFITINGEEVEVTSNDNHNWMTVCHDGRCSGIRAKGWPTTVRGWSDHFGCYLLESITRQSCLRWLPGIAPEERFDFDFHISGWDYDGPEIGSGRVPTAAPSASVMAVVQGNLAFVPGDEKLSTLLNQESARLVKLLADTQAQDAQQFRQAIRPLFESWEADNE